MANNCLQCLTSFDIFHMHGGREYVPFKFSHEHDATLQRFRRALISISISNYLTLKTFTHDIPTMPKNILGRFFDKFLFELTFANIVKSH